MKNFAGYQLNIKYDPTMLEAIELETGSAIAKRTWPVTGGTVLQSDNYGKTTAVANDVGAGIINFAEAYSNLTKYRETGVAEETGIIGKIGFRVLKAGSTAIRFEDTTAMPGAIEGTYMFDWYGENIKGYSVVQPGEIVAEGEEPTEEPVPTETSADPTPTVTEEPVPSELPDSYVIMELDKTKVKVGEVPVEYQV